MTEQYYAIDSKNVFYEIFDDENVVVNISLGNYYSMRGSANFIWSILQQPCSKIQLIDALLNEYTVGDEEAITTVDNFLQALQNEELLLIETIQTNKPNGVINEQKKPFEPPLLEIFDDLQQLLLLDPIHDADEAQGWPRPKE